MSSLLKSCLNCRAILPNNLKYLRSDVPLASTEEEIDWLLHNNIQSIVDLRSEEEQRKKPCSLFSRSEFQYYSMPVNGGNAIPPNTDSVSLSYLAMVDDQMMKILQTIENVNGGVLYFCSAGKDRTGVVSALLLKRHGFDDEYIIQDYLLSAENLKEMLVQFSDQTSIDLQIITPQKRYMEEFLAQYQK